jgi:hypothetical protein
MNEVKAKLAAYRFKVRRAPKNSTFLPFHVVDTTPDGEPETLGRFNTEEDANLYLAAKRADFASKP